MFYDDEAWESYCHFLLTERYVDNGPRLQTLRDAQESLGIGAYLSDGTAFSFCATSGDDGYDSGIDELEAKLEKCLIRLRESGAMLAAMFASKPIQYIIFLIPVDVPFELVSRGAELVKILGLTDRDHISSSVQVFIHDRNSYRSECLAAAMKMMDREDSVPVAVTRDPGEHTVARSKLKKVTDRDAHVTALMDLLLKELAAGENAIESLKKWSPEHHATLIREKDVQERRLVGENPSVSQARNLKISGIVKERAQTLIESAVLADPQAANHVAWAWIADWLLRCPLDFVDPNAVMASRPGGSK